MEGKGKILGQELHQMIDIDYDAKEILAKADAQAKEIENKTEQEQEQIVLQAKKSVEDAQQKAQQEQAELLTQKEQELWNNYNEKINALCKTIQDNKERWAQQMVQNIIGA